MEAGIRSMIVGSESLPPCTPAVPAGVLGYRPVEGAGKGGTALIAAGPYVAAEKVARLRHQAEHCRRLALGLFDERMISALEAMALEYDLKAMQFEEKRSARNG